ncbi:transglycosylase domain-containing protein [Streptomyces sp. URMC 129]|uniref:transglycosylase domain-containing protein n=1 Tax=Streptomyces sp. URMC 129 TaxID=3423407 RepID=UPI003F1C9BD5
MSEHRRKPPQGRGRRAAAPSGRRASPPPVPPAGGSPGAAPGATPDRPYGSRAEARRAAQRGGGRRRAASGAEGVAGGGRRRRAEAARRTRFIDYPRSGYSGLRRFVPSWKQVLGSCVAFFALLLGLIGIAYAMTDIPTANDMAVQESNVYYWEDGSRMVVAGESNVNRQNLDLQDIPKDMQDSVTSAENATFWEDPGIDLMGIGRAVVNMARGGETQSGSTITQQFVKNMYLTQDQTLERKARELLLSVKVGAEFTKEDILAGYLNTSYFGRGAYGIQAAAQAYYGKDAKDLDASECAFLTSLLKGPDLYDPYAGGETEGVNQANLERAEERWAWVLDRRVEVGDGLSAQERQEIAEAGFPQPNPPTKAMEKAGQIGYLTDLVDKYLISHDILTQEQLDAGGYQIYTTFNEEMVDQMEAAVEQVREENIDPEARDEDRHVQFGGAAVVPGDGAIRAIYGGVDWTEHYVNNADNPGAQVGSTFKPFVLAAAMRDGIRDPEGPPVQDADQRTPLSPDSVYRSEDEMLIYNYNGEPVMVDDEETGEPVEWRQNNFEGHSQGDITLREAMEVSANAPFVQLGMDVGPATVAEAAMDAGLREESLGRADDSVPTFALGVSTPGPIRMASAYATFAASGEQAEPYSVTRVENSRLPFTWEHDSETTQAFDSAVADNVTDVLTEVVEGDDGSAQPAQALDRPVAGKTGTTDDNKSAWFVGYTRQLSTAIGMWRLPESQEDLVGDEQMGFMPMYGTADRERINGGSLPLDIWLAFMQEATADDPVEEFPEPGEIGETHWGGGAESPAPPPQQTEEPGETEEPEESQTPDDSGQPSDEPTIPEPTTPEPTDTCVPFDPSCSDGGTDTGTDQGTDEGADQGTDTGTDTGTDQGSDIGNGNQGTDGGLFGGTG